MPFFISSIALGVGKLNVCTFYCATQLGLSPILLTRVCQCWVELVRGAVCGGCLEYSVNIVHVAISSLTFFVTCITSAVY